MRHPRRFRCFHHFHWFNRKPARSRCSYDFPEATEFDSDGGDPLLCLFGTFSGWQLVLSFLRMMNSSSRRFSKQMDKGNALIISLFTVQPENSRKLINRGHFSSILRYLYDSWVSSNSIYHRNFFCFLQQSNVMSEENLLLRVIPVRTNLF